MSALGHKRTQTLGSQFVRFEGASGNPIWNPMSRDDEAPAFSAATECSALFPIYCTQTLYEVPFTGALRGKII